MAPKKKKEGKPGGEQAEPQEEDKELLEKELVLSYLKSKLAACARALAHTDSLPACR